MGRMQPALHSRSIFVGELVATMGSLVFRKAKIEQILDMISSAQLANSAGREFWSIQNDTLLAKGLSPSTEAQRKPQ